LTQKKCVKCGEVKDTAEFSISRRAKDGLQSYCRSCQRAYNSGPGFSNLRWKSYTQSAQRRGYAFELTREQFDFICAQPCHYCGDHDSKGADRYDNDQGYTLKNTVPCCKTCNQMKSKRTSEEFLEACRRVAAHNTQRPNHEN